MHESNNTMSETSNSTKKLHVCVQEYQLLLEKMKALEKVVPSSHLDLQKRHAADVEEQEKKCREVDAAFQLSIYPPGTDSTKNDLYQSLFSTMEEIDKLNKRITKTLKSSMVVTAEELKKIKKTRPAISGYANAQDTGTPSVLKQTG